VLVGGHRERGVGVSEPFGDDLDQLAVFDQQGGVGVAEIVEPDLGEFEAGDEPIEGVCRGFG